MNEIEIKAHVKNRNLLIEKLNKIAQFKGSVVKNDKYYGKKLPNGTFDRKKIRLREEIFQDNQNKTQYLLTYKRKEIFTSTEGISTEVNDEKECTISSAEPVLAFLADWGYEVALEKHKEVMSWKYENATLELCNVFPLGDFLEIEILSPSADNETVEKCQEQIKSILEKLEISQNQIENRYYSQLLEEYKINHSGEEYV